MTGLDRLRSATLAVSPRVGARLHIGTLAVAGVYIMLLQRTQWFFFDEWAFIIEPGPGPFRPHVGHWSTAPEWIYDRLVSSPIGINNYMPYAALVTLIHLVCVHLVWRLAVKSGVAPLLATLGAAVVAVLGAGSENILWAFQIGFLGALALGLGAAVLVAAEHPGRVRIGLATALSMFSLMWSGTALSMVVATAIILWCRRTWKHALSFAVAMGAVYLAWYIPFALNAAGNPDVGGLAPFKVFIKMPAFIGVMIAYGFGRIFPIRLLGCVVAFALLVWLARRLWKRDLPPGFAPAGALMAGAAVFALLSAYTRATLSVESGQSSRYVYVLVLLGLPTMLIALDRGVRRIKMPVIAPVVLIVLMCTQGLMLLDDARFQSRRETQSQTDINAAAYLVTTGATHIDPAGRPDGGWAPNLTMKDLARLVHEGRFTPTRPTDADLASIAARVAPSQ